MFSALSFLVPVWTSDILLPMLTSH